MAKATGVAPKTEKRVRREFFPENYAAAMQLLEGWNTRADAPKEGPGRMHSAVLAFAVGKLSYLRSAIRSAGRDYRDLLWGAEAAEFNDKRGVLLEAEEPAMGPEEEALLQAIVQAPADNATRKVYADWLEERGDVRGQYLRVLCNWLDRSGDEEELIEWERELRKGLTPGWLARIRGMAVRVKRAKRK